VPGGARRLAVLNARRMTSIAGAADFSSLELMHGRDTDLLDFWQYEADPGPPAGGTSAGFFGGNADIIAMGTSRISVDVRDGLAAMSRNGFNPWAFHVIGEMLR
jgi:hypothetical protein